MLIVFKILFISIFYERRIWIGIQNWIPKDYNLPEFDAFPTQGKLLTWPHLTPFDLTWRSGRPCNWPKTVQSLIKMPLVNARIPRASPIARRNWKSARKCCLYICTSVALEQFPSFGAIKHLNFSKRFNQVLISKYFQFKRKHDWRWHCLDQENFTFLAFHFHWFSLTFIDLHWFSLICIDFHWNFQR